MSDDKSETYYVPQKFIPRGHCLHCGETYMKHDNLEDLCLKIKGLEAELKEIKKRVEKFDTFTGQLREVVEEFKDTAPPDECARGAYECAVKVLEELDGK